MASRGPLGASLGTPLLDLDGIKKNSSQKLRGILVGLDLGPLSDVGLSHASR